MTTSDAGEQRDIDAGVDQPGLSELREAESPIYPLDGPPRRAWSTHTAGLIQGDEPQAASATRQERDRVDAQSEQSFPASDPPSWPGAAL
jgi:hypothetical protein